MPAFDLHCCFLFSYYPIYKGGAGTQKCLQTCCQCTASKSRAGIQLTRGVDSKLDPRPTTGPCAFAVSGSTTLCLSGMNTSPNSQCLPSSMSQLLCLLSKRYLETNIWAPILFIAIEMSLLPGMVLSGDQSNQSMCVFKCLCIYSHEYMNPCIYIYISISACIKDHESTPVPPILTLHHKVNSSFLPFCSLNPFTNIKKPGPYYP